VPYTKQVNQTTPNMIRDFNNCFQRNPEILQDVCNHRVELCNYLLGFCNDSEDEAFYQSEIRHYKFYEV
jgi:hypothetical protein